MSKKYNYKLLDETKFLKEVGSFVDENFRINDYYFGNTPTTSFAFIGQIKWGAFEIYGINKALIFGYPSRHIVLKIEGVVTHNLLSFEIRYPNAFWVVFNAFILLLIGIMLILAHQVFFGVLIILINILQTIWSWRSAYLKKEEFLAKISTIEGVGKYDS